MFTWFQDLTLKINHLQNHFKTYWVSRLDSEIHYYLFSSFLFNLVVDTLSKKLYKTKSLGYIKNLKNFEGDNIINFNFADDTFIILSANTRMMDALKFLLIRYEHLTKINFTKSELVQLNLTEKEGSLYMLISL
jgi:hypothetical protein